MFQFTESIEIAADAGRIWETLVDIETWWPPSNPEHISIKVQSAGKPINTGTRIDFKEKVAGIKGQAIGSISEWTPCHKATWEGKALYKYYGIPLHIEEGVTWLIEEKTGVSDLSAHVWAKFPPSGPGRFLEWYATKILNVIDRDRDHARCELEYLKGIIEGADL